MITTVCVFNHILNLCDPLDCHRLSVHGLFKQEKWSGLPFPPSADITNPGIEAVSPAGRQILTTEPPGSPLTPLKNFHCVYSGLRNTQATNHKEPH